MILSPWLVNLIRLITGLAATVVTWIRPELAGAAALYLILEIRAKGIAVKLQLRHSAAKMEAENPTEIPPMAPSSEHPTSGESPAKPS